MGHDAKTLALDTESRMIARAEPNTLADIERLAKKTQDDSGNLLECESMAVSCHAMYGWFIEYGAYDGPEVHKQGRRRMQYRHYYNRLPNGSIVDSTARQFGDTCNVRLIPHDDPRQAHYIAIISEYGEIIVDVHHVWDEDHPLVTAYHEAGIKTSNVADADADPPYLIVQKSDPNQKTERT